MGIDNSMIIELCGFYLSDLVPPWTRLRPFYKTHVADTIDLRPGAGYDGPGVWRLYKSKS